MDDDNFWDGLEALELGEIPMLEEDVVVVGFPTGGDNISVTRGVVSRVDIQRYSHSGINLLAIQVNLCLSNFAWSMCERKVIKRDTSATKTQQILSPKTGMWPKTWWKKTS